MEIKNNIYDELLQCLQDAIIKGDNKMIKEISRDIERWATLCILQDEGKV